MIYIYKMTEALKDVQKLELDICIMKSTAAPTVGPELVA
jgi:hypothetical protein